MKRATGILVPFAVLLQRLSPPERNGVSEATFVPIRSDNTLLSTDPVSALFEARMQYPTYRWRLAVERIKK